MKTCLVDVLDGRDTVLHVFPIAVENPNGTPTAVDPEQEALRLAARLQLVSENETEPLHTRSHVGRGGPLTPYSDVLEIRRQSLDQVEQRIRERAYFLWQQEGCPESRADARWHRACHFDGSNGSN